MANSDEAEDGARRVEPECEAQVEHPDRVPSQGRPEEKDQAKPGYQGAGYNPALSRRLDETAEIQYSATGSANTDMETEFPTAEPARKRATVRLLWASRESLDFPNKARTTRADGLKCFQHFRNAGEPDYRLTIAYAKGPSRWPDYH